MTLQEKIKEYNLESKDWYQHAHYTIITRTGIDKIQALEKIAINFEAVKVESDFCVVKAIGVKGNLRIETFGSAKYGAKEWIDFDKANKYGKTGKWLEKGNTNTWYVMEMAEKRAMSRVVLKITGFYQLGVFGEDESEDFKRKEEVKVKEEVKRNEALTIDKFEKAKLFTPEQIQQVLDTFRMSSEQRKDLTKLI